MDLLAGDSTERMSISPIVPRPYFDQWKPTEQRTRTPAAAPARALVRRRFGVTGLQNVHQGCQTSAQVLGPVGDRLGHAIGVVRARADAVRQLDRMIVHLLETLTNRRTCVLGKERVVPFQGIQQLLPDRVVIRMAP